MDSNGSNDKMEIFPLELSGSTSSTSLHYPSIHTAQNGFQSYYRQPTFKRNRCISLSSEHHRVLNGLSTAILFRDSNGTPVLQPLGQFGMDERGIMEDDIINFFKCYKCYDLIPTSAKLVVLDSKLVVKKAFYAMVDTGVRACPLWDSSRQQYIGMLTITDFIRILQNNYKGSDKVMVAFEEQRLCDVKGVSTEEPSDVYHMYPDSSLYDATLLLLKKQIHRLPIIDPSNGNVIYIMTQKPLLRFLYTLFPNFSKVGILSKTLRESGVGTNSNIKVATEDTRIIDALNIFIEDRISALPIVDSEGKLIHIYSKFDVINLAAEKTYSNLEVTLDKANEHRTEWFDGVHTCTADETVFAVMEKLVKTDVARLVVVDDERKVTGIVTVSDIIWYLVVRPKNSTSDFSRKIVRNSTVCRREDSIGEEFEELDEFSCDDLSEKSFKGNSCSPPRWFHV